MVPSARVRGSKVNALVCCRSDSRQNRASSPQFFLDVEPGHASRDETPDLGTTAVATAPGMERASVHRARKTLCSSRPPRARRPRAGRSERRCATPKTPRSRQGFRRIWSRSTASRTIRRDLRRHGDAKLDGPHGPPPIFFFGVDRVGGAETAPAPELGWHAKLGTHLRTRRR